MYSRGRRSFGWPIIIASVIVFAVLVFFLCYTVMVSLLVSRVYHLHYHYNSEESSASLLSELWMRPGSVVAIWYDLNQG